MKASFPDLRFADASKHGLVEERSYTVWDLEAIERAHWVFAYLEKDNPGGYALSLEVGYARALGKRIILVDEKSPTDPKLADLLGMVRACAHVSFETLEQGTEFMARIEGLPST